MKRSSCAKTEGEQRAVQVIWGERASRWWSQCKGPGASGAGVDHVGQ